MKIRFLFAALILFALSGCWRNYNYPIYPTAQAIKKDINFQIESLHEGTVNGRIKAKRGSKLIRLNLIFYSQSKEEFELNLNDIYLADTTRKIIYKNLVVTRSSGLLIKDSQISVKSFHSRKIEITYVVARGFKPESLIINQKLFPINFKENVNHQPY